MSPGQTRKEFLMTDSRRKQQFRRVMYDSRFDRFLSANKVDLDRLAEALRMTRPNLVRLRAGRQQPRQDTIARLVLTLRAILGRPVAASDLFYLGEERDDHTPEAEAFRGHGPLGRPLL